MKRLNKSLRQRVLPTALWLMLPAALMAQGTLANAPNKAVRPASQSAGVTHKSQASTIVTVMQKGDLPRGAKTIVMLRKQVGPQTLIVVDPHATAVDLASAFKMVARLRAKYGDTPPAQDVRVVPKRALIGRGVKPAAMNRMNKYLGALSVSRNRTDVHGVGEGRFITVVLASAPGQP